MGWAGSNGWGRGRGKEETFLFPDTPNFVVAVVVKSPARVECDCFLSLSRGRNSVFGTCEDGFERLLDDVFLSRHLASFCLCP